MKSMSNQGLDAFAKWRDILLDHIEHLKQTLPTRVADAMDNSIASLDILGEWIIEQYGDEMQQTGDFPPIHKGVECYVGEVYRTNLGGYWNVHSRDLEPDFQYGQELVIEWFGDEAIICPYYEILLTLKYSSPRRLSEIAIRLQKKHVHGLSPI